jgi:hypothetical protein
MLAPDASQTYLCLWVANFGGRSLWLIGHLSWQAVAAELGLCYELRHVDRRCEAADCDWGLYIIPLDLEWKVARRGAAAGRSSDPGSLASRPG